MKNLLVSILIILFISCNNDNKDYRVIIQDQTITIIMPSPTTGFQSFNVTTLPHIDEIEEEIFNKRNKMHGMLSVYVEFTGIDKYGNRTVTRDLGYIGKINSTELNRYVSFKYFRGEIERMIFNALTPKDPFSTYYIEPSPKSNQDDIDVTYFRDNLFVPKEKRRTGPDFTIKKSY